MGSYPYEPRTYRGRMGRDPEMSSFLIVEKETDLWISLPREAHTPCLEIHCAAYIRNLRSELEDYLEKNPEFSTSLVPIPQDPHGPPIAHSMIAAAAQANVGPMATVAGAFSAALGQYLEGRGIQKMVVENGGDIYCKGLDVLRIGVYAGDTSPFSNALTLEIDTSGSSWGICSSSGVFGHSLSLGKADVVTIVAKDALLADAYATGICNLIQSKEDIAPVTERIQQWPGISGAVLIKEEKLGIFGNLRLARV